MANEHTRGALCGDCDYGDVYEIVLCLGNKSLLHEYPHVIIRWNEEERKRGKKGEEPYELLKEEHGCLFFSNYVGDCESGRE